MLRAALIVVGVLVVVVAAVGVTFFLGMRAKTPAIQGLVRRFNRRVGNPYQMKTAGSAGAYASVIHHVGRRSGTAYETPIVPFPVEGGFIVALPYDTRPDWLRNVLAAGGATLVTEGRTYEVDRPEVVDTDDLMELFPVKEQSTLRRFRVTHSLRLHTVRELDAPT